MALTLLSAFVCTYAQTDSITVDNKTSMRSTMIGVGSANVLDTYLSPYSYKGTEVRIMRETMRMTHLMDGKVSNQTLIDVNGSMLENRAKTADEYAAGIRYSIGWHYNINFNNGNDNDNGNDKFKPFHPSNGEGAAGDFGIGFGPVMSGYLGGIWNTRNGNNPGQAKLDLCIDLSGMAYYNLRIGKKNCLLRYQVNIPFVGMAFSPNYGQSYYEIFSLGHYDHNAVFAHIGNMPSMRHLLTADFPIGRNTLRIGYSGQFNQSLFNELRYHSYSHNFMIGFVKRVVRK